MAKGLTDKQRKVLEYIIDFQKENGFPPTIRELGDAFNIGSLRGVTVHLDALVRKGFIVRGRASRSIKMTAPDPREPHCNGKCPNAVALPLLSSAVQLTAADAECIQYVAVPQEMAVPAMPNGFVVRIGAAGVTDEAIMAGDLAVIHPQEKATPGELVVSRQNGGFAVRRASESDDAIAGRVIGILRRY